MCRKECVLIIMMTLFCASSATAAPRQPIGDTTFDLQSVEDVGSRGGDMLDEWRGNVVTFREDHIMLVNGEPYFPIGKWWWEREPWNTVNDYEWMPCHLEQYDVEGMWFLGQDLFQWYTPQRYSWWTACLDSDNFLGWYSKDEPVWSSRPGGSWEGGTFEELLFVYNRLKEDDPYHPVWMNFAAADVSDDLDIWIEKRRQYAQAADIVGVDVYPSGFGPGSRQCDCGSPNCVVDNPHISVVGDFVDILIDDVVEGQKPVWMVIQAWGDVTEYEIRFQYWQTVIHGATGVFVWSKYAPWDLIMPDAANATQELIDLHPVLVAETVDATVTSTSGIETMVKQVDGYYYILSVNREPDPSGVTAEFDLSSLGITTDGIVEIINEDSTVEIIDGHFTLAYAAFDTHIIRVAQSSGHTVNPYTSSMTLTHEEYPGITTCPAGDGSIYRYVKVTVNDATGEPIAGIPADQFLLTGTPVQARYVDAFSCTFNAVDEDTNSNGELRFTVVCDTAIIGGINLEVTVMDIPLIDREILQSKSYDLNLDGRVDLTDMGLWSREYGTSNYSCDFDWDGAVTITDFGQFCYHFGHQSI